MLFVEKLNQFPENESAVPFFCGYLSLVYRTTLEEFFKRYENIELLESDLTNFNTDDALKGKKLKVFLSEFLEYACEGLGDYYTSEEMRKDIKMILLYLQDQEDLE